MTHAAPWTLAAPQARTARVSLTFVAVAAYLVVLVLAPPLGTEVDFASRGVKVDQILLLPWLYLVAIARPRSLVAVLRSPVFRAFALFALASLASSLSSMAFVSEVNPGAALANAWGSIRWLILYACASATLEKLDPAERRRLLFVMVGLGMVVIVVATLQLAGVGAVYEFTTRYYQRKAEFDTVLESLAGGRAYGTFDGQSNVYGTFAAMMLAVLCALLVNRAGKLRFFWYVALLGLYGWGLAISWSRGAYAGALVAVAIVTVLSGRYQVPKLAIPAVAGSAVLYASLPDPLKDRFVQLLEGRGYSAQESIFASRLPFWEADWELFLQHPILGVRGIHIAPPDSLYLGLLVVNGLLGAVLFFRFIAIVLGQLWRVWRTSRAPETLAVLVALVSLLVNGISTPTFFGERVQEVVVFLLVIALAPSHDGLGAP